ncbi:hypothetical protein BU23DRAFT_448317 [Bimuria novae-zelandiae CBS 107.79]|uniref:Zn(2)-C6 fungal-type domain-containing protein n=1 Tax=Bimuria novae-zelandiae CBS 107.79 TaxID=1447943 RepID=A0A6A5VVY8_9PLEO|nr:hypothetical protein BU23DRAFT_448317 [Bimuria novae-zelandiae CBS 107.79]
MTRTGKCDTCRSRKVKCDEQRPKCGACSKRDRECTYSFGKVSAFVAEDPTQLSKHGKPKVAPAVYPLEASHEPDVSPTPITSPSTSLNLLSSTALPLRQNTGRDAESGDGVFMTLSIPTHEKSKVWKRATAQQRKKLQLHLNQLQDATALLAPRQFVTSQTALASRYLHLLGSWPAHEQPFAILGTWTESMPARIGKSSAVDLAVEYLINSLDVYREPSFSGHRTALVTKARALKELQLAIGDEKTRRSYDVAIATKIHMMAEIFMGIKNLYHAIHAAGLGDILQTGPVTDIDDEHYWSFLDTTYIDDVSEAMVASRTSIYDNRFYLEMTDPTTVAPDASDTFRVSVAMMHVYIQLPRLVCLVRHATNFPEDARTLASAVALAENLWSLVPSDIMQNIIQRCVTSVNAPPSSKIADIIPNSYHFNSVQNCMLISRFWRLKTCLSGPIQTLYQNFPAECASSLLPPLPIVEKTDVDAATELARCIRYALTICPSLPLIPLRVYTCFQISLGGWYRQIQRLTTSINALPPEADPSVTAYLNEQLSRAQRMEQFVADGSNAVHDIWRIQRVNKRFLRAAAVDMAGGPIPGWMPIRVKFENEDGDMVMKMEYELGGLLNESIMEDSYTGGGWVRKTRTMSPFRPDTADFAPGKGFPNG